MQRSIKSFFKTKQPANSSPPPPKSEEEEENKANNDLENRAKNPEEVAPKEKGDTQLKQKSQETTAINKRAATDDFDFADADDDEEVVFKRKRQATSFLDSPPSKKEMATKQEDNNDSPAKAKAEQKEESKVTAAMSTPSKQVPTATPSKQQLFSQSPLLSVEALIRKKISSGSQALHENIGTTWFKALQPEFDKPYFKKLSAFVEQQRKTKTVFPPADQVFTWTHYHPIRDTRVVIIGQDPYHGPRQAHGLSFSVQKGVAIPKSLGNIYKELANDIDGFKPPPHGNLVGWAKQGVLLLNACLTVNQGDPNSHQSKGWENLTDAVISWISKKSNHKVVFLLWGKFAQKKATLIDKRHKVLTAAHPSPFSADSGFFGCKHFSQTNAFLKSQKLPEINWSDL